MEYPFIRQLSSPLTDAQLRPLDPRCEVVQFDEPLTDSEMKRVAAFMRDYPNITFRVYGHYSEGCDLEFLRHFDFLRNFQVNIYKLKSVSGISYLNHNLEFLGLGQTQCKHHSLGFLEKFSSLRELYIEGHTKDIEVVSQLAKLESVTLRSITLPDLSILKPLRQLQSFDLKLGGTKNLKLLPEIGKLRYLEIWMVKGLDNLEPVADIHTLQYLFLQALRRVIVLPSLHKLALLRRVHIETMKGLQDLKPVADAPVLEDILVIDMPHLQPSALQPFVGHPTLKSVKIGLGSIKKNEAAQKLLNLPDVDNHKFNFKFL
jgi:hypothetical protein